MDHGRSPAADGWPLAELLKRLDALERRTGELERIIVEKDAIIAAQRVQIETLQTALERANEQLALFKKTLFGPRRERYAPSPDQPLLFAAVPLDEAPEPVASAVPAAEEMAEEMAEATPAKPPRKLRR